MVEIRYRDSNEIIDLAGKTVAEARESFRDEFGISAKAKARLNGKKVKTEAQTILGDNDTLSFAEEKSHKAAILVGAMLVSLAISGAVFAFGFTTDTITLGATTTGYDFAEVSANTSDAITWSTYGKFRGAITDNGTMFDIRTDTSAYDGDLTVTLSLANADQLSQVYRLMALKVRVKNSAGVDIDINGDDAVTAKDFTLLTMNNGSVDFYINQLAADYYTIWVESGFYISNVVGSGWTATYEDPQFFCEVAQR